MAGPQFVQYFEHVISALKELGNSGRPAEVRELISQKLKLSDAKRNEQISSGGSRFENQVAWAKFYLSKDGYIDSSKRGVWSLTEKGISSNLTPKNYQEILERVREQVKDSTSIAEDDFKVSEEKTAPPDIGISIPNDYRSELLEIIRKLPPVGFEKLCQRLLRESGFQQVEVTGRTGDGGIDGRGILQINPLLSMQVIFQCKRYNAKTAISAPQIRDFRGAMAGRTDKGIFLTTSTFTAEARKEAFREGASPIELVDGEKLVDMFVQLELGLVPKTVYEVDTHFFDEFA